MSNGSKHTVMLEALDDSVELALGELCRVCGVHAELIMALVEEGIIEPSAVPARGQPRFPAPAVRRVQVYQRLSRDLGVNRAGAGLALDLLDELRELRRRVEVLERQLFFD